MLRRILLVAGVLLVSAMAFAFASQSECGRHRLLVVNGSTETVDLALIDIHWKEQSAEVWRGSLPEFSARRAAFHPVAEGGLVAVLTRSDGRREEVIIGYVTSHRLGQDMLLIDQEDARHAFWQGSLLFDVDSDGAWATFAMYAGLAHELGGCLAKEATQALW